MFRVLTNMWGHVDVRYWRGQDGSDGLYVPSVRQTVSEWTVKKIGPPPILCEMDVGTGALWGSYKIQALRADVDDDRLNVTPTATTDTAPLTFEYANPIEPNMKPKKQRKSKPKPKPVTMAILDPIPPPPPPLSPGLASFANPAEFGMKQTRPARG